MSFNGFPDETSIEHHPARNPATRKLATVIAMVTPWYSSHYPWVASHCSPWYFPWLLVAKYLYVCMHACMYARMCYVLCVYVQCGISRRSPYFRDCWWYQHEISGMTGALEKTSPVSLSQLFPTAKRPKAKWARPVLGSQQRSSSWFINERWQVLFDNWWWKLNDKWYLIMNKCLMDGEFMVKAVSQFVLVNQLILQTCDTQS